LNIIAHGLNKCSITVQVTVSALLNSNQKAKGQI